LPWGRREALSGLPDGRGAARLGDAGAERLDGAGRLTGAGRLMLGALMRGAALGAGRAMLGRDV
jgi:hypothetical protein